MYKSIIACVILVYLAIGCNDNNSGATKLQNSDVSADSNKFVTVSQDSIDKYFTLPVPKEGNKVVGPGAKIAIFDANQYIKNYDSLLRRQYHPKLPSGGVSNKPINARKIFHRNTCEGCSATRGNCQEDMSLPSFMIDTDLIRLIINEKYDGKSPERLKIYPSIDVNGDYTLILLGSDPNGKAYLHNRNPKAPKDANQIYDYIDPCRPCKGIK